jgi:hypothetical protein
MNLKMTVIAGITAGMMALTGCAGNTPATNDGNRTGEQITNSINRATDNYRSNNNYNNGLNGNNYNYYNRDGSLWNSYNTSAPTAKNRGGYGLNRSNNLNNNDINRGTIGSYNR